MEYCDIYSLEEDFRNPGQKLSNLVVDFTTLHKMDNPLVTQRHFRTNKFICALSMRTDILKLKCYGVPFCEPATVLSCMHPSEHLTPLGYIYVYRYIYCAQLGRLEIELRPIWLDLGRLETVLVTSLLLFIVSLVELAGAVTIRATLFHR